MVGGCCPVHESAGKGMNLTAFWVGFTEKLIGKEQWEHSDASRCGGCSCSTSSVPAQGQPQLSPSLDGYHSSQQTPAMLCLHLAAPAPQNCTRTFPNLKIPAQPLLHQPTPPVPSNSPIPVHIPHSQSWFSSQKYQILSNPLWFQLPDETYWTPLLFHPLTSLLQLLGPSASKDRGTFFPKQLWCFGSTERAWPYPLLQLLAKALLNVAAIKENDDFLKPFKDSVGLIALVFTIWLSDVGFSWKKNN